MEYIHKLPFVVGSFMAIVVGLVNYKLGVDQQDTYTRIAISLVLFFVVGLVIRNTLSSLYEEFEKKRREQEELEAKEQSQVHSQNPDESAAASDGEKAAGESHSKVDYRVKDGEEFTALNVSEMMKSTGEKV